jgi:hypothetical protein
MVNFPAGIKANFIPMELVICFSSFVSANAEALPHQRHSTTTTHIFFNISVAMFIRSFSQVRKGEFHPVSLAGPRFQRPNP